MGRADLDPRDSATYRKTIVPAHFQHQTANATWDIILHGADRFGLKQSFVQPVLDIVNV